VAGFFVDKSFFNGNLCLTRPTVFSRQLLMYFVLLLHPKNGDKRALAGLNLVTFEVEIIHEVNII